MHKPLAIALLAASLTAALLVSGDARTAPPGTAHSLDDYRHFRAVCVDLLGRMPTREEVTEFEQPGFNFDQWIEKHLDTSAYADRLTRIYMDLLRLEPGPAVNYSPEQSTLFRKTIVGPDGKDTYVYFRKSQRRAREETDADFCLTATELEEDTSALPKPKAVKPPPAAAPKPGAAANPGGSPLGAGPQPVPPPAGVQARQGAPGPGANAPKPAPGKPGDKPPMGAADAMGKGAMVAPLAAGAMPPNPMQPEKPKGRIKKKTLDEYTVLVKPWWLYQDYKSREPTRRYKQGWSDVSALYQPSESLLFEPDKSPTEQVRICKEEAQAEEIGHIHATGRTKPIVKDALPKGRTKAIPADSGYANNHRGDRISCRNKQAYSSTIECGCGVGLEACLPTDNDLNIGNGFYYPLHAPLGLADPIDNPKQQTGKWYPLWWSQESEQFFHYIFKSDRDFRELLTSHATFVNGPLTQFYRETAPANCCGAETNFGMVDEPEPLFNPAALPPDLLPHDVETWKMVADRGPHAAGLLTMPSFLEKYASRRARGAILYTAFLCKSFIAENVDLPPSDEPNLMIRPGCSTCHATLEPLAAYFSRVEESNWVFLPPTLFPASNPTCKKNAQGKISGQCGAFYDGSFATGEAGFLKGAYASLDHANSAPAGAGRDITSSPDFAKCAVERVTSSFLGRPMTSDDQALVQSLTETFVAKGYKMRSLVASVIRSNAYQRANNLSSTTWRGGDK